MGKVSVIIPVYNVEKYISNTIQSVLDQTYQNFEVLIVDDVSSDKTVEICQNFNDPRIQVFCHKENRGPSGTSNTGIRHSKGEYIALLDGDDIWLPEKLEMHVQHLKECGGLGVSFSPSDFIDDTGQSLGSRQKPKLKNILVSDLLLSNPLGNGSAAVYRREVFEAIKFQDNIHGFEEDCYFDEHFRMIQDLECLLRIVIQTTWKVEGIPKVLTRYRVNPHGVSSNLLKNIEAWDQVIEKIRTYDSQLVSHWENRSRAHLLRYLARRAVRLHQGALAVDLIHRALFTHWCILFEGFRFTTLTWIAAYLVWLIPKSIYCYLESIVSSRAMIFQKR
ncbi:glycosyltransferase family 2 protein [Stenomitos frigidus]|uniref:Glucosyl transferase n=1 Tax=Stenomitos frigidus ULC18 TaxID=2107698 RepID=A0A2T1ED19_9CYAN|nr:glycosyltransferase family 2 protein [Stenomitos frigidus]PSB30595.1 glucosyl transferase [Stenomitos frigidus ULC18]